MSRRNAARRVSPKHLVVQAADRLRRATMEVLEERRLLSTTWAYGATVDESVFNAGGTGKVIYVSADATGSGTGTSASPYTVNQAKGQIQTVMQSQDVKSNEILTSQSTSFAPYWLKLVRSGNSFSAYIAPDNSGSPGTYTLKGDTKTITMGNDFYVGLLVNNKVRDSAGEASAVFSSAKLNGTAVSDSTWKNTPLGTTNENLDKVTNAVTTSSGTLTIKGSGTDLAGDGNFWYDNGNFVYLKVSGDTTFEVRLDSLTKRNASDGAGNAALMMREKLDTDGQMMELKMSVTTSGGTETWKMRQDWRVNRSTPGQPLKIVLKAGNYYEQGFGEIWGRDGVARDLPLVIEGERVNGENAAIFYGSVAPSNWIASGWLPYDTDGDGTAGDVDDKNVYYRSGWDWNNFFKASSDPTVANRNTAESVILTKAGGSEIRLNQVMLEGWTKNSSNQYTYTGFTAPTLSNIATLLPAGSFAVNELGSTTSDAGKSVSTPSGNQTFKAIFDANPHGYANTVFMRLPDGISSTEFFSNDGNSGNDTAVRVVRQGNNFLVYDYWAGLNPWGMGNKGVVRNLTLNDYMGPRPFVIGNWTDYVMTNSDWKFENLTINQAKEQIRLQHMRNVTIDNLKVTNSTQKLELILSEGKMLNSSVINSKGIGNALRNFYIDNLIMDGNQGGFRNDHTAENLLIENSQFNNTAGYAMIFETTFGPVVVKNSEFRNNDPGTGTESNGVIGLFQAQNITFDGNLFENNKVSVFDFYDRDRSHTPKQIDDDEMGGDMDRYQWSIERFDPNARTTPGGRKPIAWNRNYTVINNTFRATGASTMFYRSHVWTSGQRQWAFNRVVGDELIAYNNTYHNPDNTKPFEGKDQVKKTFAEWKTISTQANFEASSEWTSGTRSTTFTPAAIPTDPSDLNKNGTQVASGRYWYEVENLNYAVSNKATGGSQTVELISDSAASSGKAHKLRVDDISNTVGDYIAYTLNVPVAGDYYVNVRYLQDEGAFRSLGYARLKIDGNVQGSYWDQSGLTREFKDAPLGKVTLSAGDHTFRFDPVWRNGYISGKYDITIDRIELVSAQDLRPAGTPTVSTNGLSYKYYETTSNWYQLPDFSSLTPTSTGTQTASNRRSFSDNFADNSINTTHWTRMTGTNEGVWTESGGILSQSATTQVKDANGNITGRYMTRLTDAANVLNSGDQTILAKVRVDSWTDGKFAKAGVSLFNDSLGRGYSLNFAKDHSTLQFEDGYNNARNSVSFNWSNGTWYWFKLTSQGGELYGKVWADGAAEPTTWTAQWNATPGTSAMGSAGLFSGSGDSAVSFDEVSVTTPSNFAISVKPASRDLRFAAVFDGFLDVPADGLYTFYTEVNDGANLWIGDTLVLDNDGVHDGERNEPWEKNGKIALKAGKHPIKVAYFNGLTSQNGLTVSWEGPDFAKQLIPDNRLWVKGANIAPAIATNSGLAVNAGAANVVIGIDKLKATDTDADTITYALSAIPSQGSLKLNGNTLAVGGKFTQDDLDSQRVTYSRSDSSVTADSFSFTAADGQGGSIAATTFNIVVLPAAPTQNAPTTGDAKITVNWSTVANATGYKVKYGTASGNYTTILDVPGDSTSSKEVTGLVNGTTYYFVVTAYNSGGESANSTERSAAPVAAANGNAFSDTFSSGTALGSAWTTKNGTWSVASGVAQQTSTAYADPRKAILSNSGASFGSNQQILAKVRVDSWTAGDMARAGVGLFTDSSTGEGYNLLFTSVSGVKKVRFLDDNRQWSSTSWDYNFSTSTWYWFKLRNDGITLYGKVWADGSAEPSTWYSWTPSNTTRFTASNVYPSLNGGSARSTTAGNSTVSFDDVMASKMLATETFGSSASNWSTTSGTTYSVTGGKYQASNSGTTGGRAYLTAGTSWSNYSVEGTLNVSSLSTGGNFGLFFRYQDANNWYAFRYNQSNSKWEFVKRVGGSDTVTTLSSSAYSLSTGTDYKVKIVANGQSFSFYVAAGTGTYVQQGAGQTATNFSTGSVGYFAYRSTLTLDDLLVSSLS